MRTILPISVLFVCIHYITGECDSNAALICLSITKDMDLTNMDEICRKGQEMVVCLKKSECTDENDQFKEIKKSMSKSGCQDSGATTRVSVSLMATFLTVLLAVFL